MPAKAKIQSHRVIPRSIASVLGIVFLLAGAYPCCPESNTPSIPLEWNVFLDQWRLIGPFPAESSIEGIQEGQIPDTSQSIKFQDKDYSWQTYQGGGVNFDSFFEPEIDNNSCFAYALAVVNSGQEQDAVLACGFDDSATIWVNGEEVYRQKRTGGCTLDEFKTPVHLKKGDNAIFFKIDEGGGSWEMIARLLPAGIEKLLLTGESKLKKWYFIAHPPILLVEFLDGDGKAIQKSRCSGFRLNEGFTRFPVYTPNLKTEPAQVRVTLESDSYKPFQKTYVWAEIQEGKIPITLDGNRALSGRIVDTDGKPVANARLTLDEDFLPIRSNTEGKFQLIDIEPSLCNLAVFAEGYQSLSKAIDFSKEDVVEFKLERGGLVLKGTILDEEGKPIEGASIYVLTRSPKPKDISDAQGRFVLAGITENRTRISPVITHPNFIGKGSFGQSMESTDVTEVTYTLEKGGSVAGRVVSKENGKPILNVRIIAGNDRFGSNVVNPSATTDDQGTFQVKNITPGEQTVNVFSDRYAPEMKTILIKKGETIEANFELEAGSDATGQVTDEDGKPIQDVWIVTDTWQGIRMFEREAHTDAEGKFTLAHMPSSPASVDIMKKNYISVRGFNMAGGVNHKIVLRPAFSLTVDIRLSDTGEIPETITIDQGHQWDSRQITWSVSNESRNWDKKTGTHKTEFDEEIRSQTMLFRYTVPGYKAGIVEVPASTIQSITASLRLERAPAGLKGRVVSKKTGEPMSELTLAVVNSQNRLRFDQYRDISGGRMALDHFSGVKTQTDEKGCFELPYIDDMEDSMLVLLPPKEGFFLVKNISSQLVDGSLLIQFPASGSIKGRMTIGGEPVASVELLLMWLEEGNRRYDSPFGYGGQITSDRDGYFEFRGLAAGHYQLSRGKSIPEAEGGRITYYLDGKELTLAEGQEITHNFERPAGVSLKGRTLITEDIPLANCIVTLSDESGQRVDAVKSDEKGDFAFENAPQGNVRLEANLRSRRRMMTTRGRGEMATGQTSVAVEGPTTADILLKAQSSEIYQELIGIGGALKGKKSPDFTGKYFEEEKTVTLSSLQGKIVILVFWSLFDEKCIEQFPALKDLHQRYKEDSRISLLTVNLDYEADDVKTAVQKYELPFPILFSGEGLFDEIFALYGMKTAPSALVIDAEGKIASDRIEINEIEAVVKPMLK